MRTTTNSLDSQKGHPMATTPFALVRSMRLVWFLALVLWCGIGGGGTAAAGAEEPVGTSAPANLTGIGTSMPVPQLPPNAAAGAAFAAGIQVQNAIPPSETTPLTTEAVEYYGYDAIGSVRVVFDAAGTVVGRSEFLPFGDEWLTSSNMPVNRFTGQERDPEAGFDYFNARMYQPRAGRFGRVDPVLGGLGNPQRWNRYAYALNNPFGYTDPTGLDPIRFKDSADVTGKMPPPLSLDLFGLLIENPGGGGGSSDLGGCSVPIMLPGGCDGGGKLRAGGDAGVPFQQDETPGDHIHTDLDGDGVTDIPDDDPDHGKNPKGNATDVTPETIDTILLWKGVAKFGAKTMLSAMMGRPPLRMMHSPSILSKSTLEYWGKRSTDEIVESLAPGLPESLKVYSNGIIANGNARIYLLIGRGFDVNSLRRDLPR